MSVFFHRGSWIPKVGIVKPSDILVSNDLEGKSIFVSKSADREETLSWQPYSLEDKRIFDGYELIEYANAAAKLSPDRKPVILSIEINHEAFEKYKSHIAVVLKKGYETDITQSVWMQDWRAVLVNADQFTFDEFIRYQSELFTDSDIVKTLPDMVRDMNLNIYPINEERYWQFIESLRDGNKTPLYTKEQISEILTKRNLEGSASNLESTF